MTTEDHLDQTLQQLQKENNEAEKTISLQLIGVAIFVTTVIGAFIVLPFAKPLGLTEKIFLLIDVIALFLSLSFGIVNLLVTRNMWSKAADRAELAQDVIAKMGDESERVEVANVLTGSFRTSMVFFYLQLSLLGVAVVIFLGLIIALLF
jgi:hypothetical protein